MVHAERERLPWEAERKPLHPASGREMASEGWVRLLGLQ